jgi:hypothetical protein
VSLLVTIHLTAVVAAPWRLLTPPALPPNYIPVDTTGRLRPDLPPPPMDHPDRQVPPLIAMISGWLTPYMNLTFINHGYEFFAPNPAATHLIRYQAYDAQGVLLHQEVFPDRQAQWPRLFYHRHMMLAEQVGELGPDGLRTYGRYLLEKHQAAHVRLEYGIHYLLSPQQVRDGILLDATRTYDTVDTVDVYRSSGDGAPRLPTGARVPGVSP